MKTALVTGGLNGIGLHITQTLIKRGMQVYATSRKPQAAGQYQLENVIPIACDLATAQGRQELLDSLPPLSILVNNAGHMNKFALAEYDAEARDYSLQINMIAPIELAWHIGNKMAKNGGGRIVNNASIAAHRGHPDIWYGVAKAGLLNATKILATTLGKDGIIINSVAPSAVEDTNVFEPSHYLEKPNLKKLPYLADLPLKTKLPKQSNGWRLIAPLISTASASISTTESLCANSLIGNTTSNQKNEAKHKILPKKSSIVWQ